MQENSNDRSNVKEVLLTTASNSFEAETLEALLQSNDIPVLKKYREAGAYLEIYMGSSNFGVDIYVASDMYDKAKEILESSPEYDEDMLQQDSPAENAELTDISYKKRQRALTWLIILVFMPGALGAILYAFYKLYNLIVS